MTWKGLFASFKLMLTNIGAFLAPFVKQFESEAGTALSQIAMTALAESVSSGGQNLTNSQLRDQFLAKVEQEVIAAGINAGETAIMNALQAAYTSMHPEKAVVSFVANPPSA